MSKRYINVANNNLRRTRSIPNAAPSERSNDWLKLFRMPSHRQRRMAFDMSTWARKMKVALCTCGYGYAWHRQKVPDKGQLILFSFKSSTTTSIMIGKEGCLGSIYCSLGRPLKEARSKYFEPGDRLKNILFEFEFSLNNESHRAYDLYSLISFFILFCETGKTSYWRSE